MHLAISEAQRQLELLRLDEEIARRECRRSFLQYCRHPDLFPDEPPAKHHAFMIGALEGVERGEIKRLMVLMPPGHGKSVYCSIRFPSWYLGKYPKQYLIHATYGGELASLNGRKVRNLIDCEEYAAIFRDVTIADDFKGRADWATSQGGQYYATGVGGGVTGRRAHGALLDDLVKDRKEADSVTKRETVWDWYKTALRTRLRKDGWIETLEGFKVVQIDPWPEPKTSPRLTYGWSARSRRYRSLISVAFRLVRARRQR